MLWGRPLRGQYAVINVVDGVGDPRVFGNFLVGIVGDSLRVENYVFKQGPRANGPKNFRLLFFGEVDDLGVASALKVEYESACGPAVLVIANELAVRVSAQGGFARARESEEERGGTVLTHVGGAVHGQGVVLGG